MTETTGSEQTPEAEPIDTTNDFIMQTGENLPNHSLSQQGLGKFVRQGIPSVPQFRTKQDAYRYAAYLVTLAEVHLPDLPGCESHDFEAVLNAVRNS